MFFSKTECKRWESKQLFMENDVSTTIIPTFFQLIEKLMFDY